VLVEETTTGNNVVRTYAAWGPAGVNTVAFYRPSALTTPGAHGLALYSTTGFTMPSDPVCAADSGSNTDDTDQTDDTDD